MIGDQYSRRVSDVGSGVVEGVIWVVVPAGCTSVLPSEPAVCASALDRGQQVAPASLGWNWGGAIQHPPSLSQVPLTLPRPFQGRRNQSQQVLCQRSLVKASASSASIVRSVPGWVIRHQSGSVIDSEEKTFSAFSSSSMSVLLSLDCRGSWAVMAESVAGSSWRRSSVKSLILKSRG